MHLDKNLFCFFTMYCYQDSDDSALHRVVECTKFRATKVIEDKSCKHGHLDLELVGYQSYQCDSLLALHGVLPMTEGVLLLAHVPKFGRILENSIGTRHKQIQFSMRG